MLQGPVIGTGAAQHTMVPAISLNDYEKKDCYGLKLSLNYWPVAATAQTSCVYNWHELGLLEPILLLFIRKPIQLGFFLPENQLYHLYGDGAMVLQGPRLRGDAAVRKAFNKKKHS